MASAELAALIAAKREHQYSPDMTVEALRRATEETGRLATLPEGVTIQAVTANGVPSEWIDMPRASEDEVFLFIHGGGYYRGSVAASRSPAAHISAASGARCLSIDYRLAPEHPFPAAVEDAHAAYRWLLEQGFAAENVVVGGISAGGGLTLALLLTLRDAGEPLPVAAIPVSAWTDLTQSGDSFRTNAAIDPAISKAYLDRMAGYYLDGADPRHPLASPLYGELVGLPPLLIQVGTAEAMLDDSTELARRAEAAGVEARLETWEGLIHGWHGSAHSVPEAREAIRRIGEFFREQVGR